MATTTFSSLISKKISFKHFLYIFLPLYTAFYVYVLTNHELWRDEIQPWGVAASSNNLSALISKMEYEGRPPLWQLILFLVSRVSMDPNSMKFIAAGIFICNTALVLSFRKFSPGLRILILLGFYFIYGYSVTARDYNLLLLLHLLTMKYFEKKNERQWKFLLLLLAMGMVNGYGLVLAIFWATVELGKKRSLKVGIIKYVPTLLVAFLVFVIQQIFKPPADSVFATHLQHVSFSEIKRAISNVFIFPFLPIHHEQPPTLTLMIVAFSILTLVVYTATKIDPIYRLALLLTFVFSVLNSFFGYYLYWWHFGAIYLVLLASMYASVSDNKRQKGLNYSIVLVLSLQIFGTLFGFGKDFEPSKSYSNIAHASAFINRNCEKCVVVTDSSVFGSPIASFIRPTKVYAVDARQFVDFAIWKRTYMREVTEDEITAAALKFKNVIVVTSQSKILNPNKFALMKTFSKSVWGDNFRIYKPVARMKEK